LAAKKLKREMDGYLVENGNGEGGAGGKEVQEVEHVEQFEKRTILRKYNSNLQS